MQIDWFTLVAQIANFLILVFLLQHFLYGPVVDAMDRRQARIAEKFEEARAERDKAAEEAERYRQQRQGIEAKKEKLLAEARHEVEAQRAEMLEQAHREVEDLRREWVESVYRDREQFAREFRRTLGEQTLQLARRALSDLANARLEEMAVDAFIQQLANMEESQRRDIAESIREAGRSVLVRSAFEIPEAARTRLEQEIQDKLLDEDSLKAEYERAEDLVFGLEVHADGGQINWTVDHYLGEVLSNLQEFMEEELREGQQA